MRIVLASESASRRRALDILGLRYDVWPSRIDEKAIREDDPKRLVTKLSEAEAIKATVANKDSIIVAGDAVVACAGKTYEKPVDAAEAGRFLREFSVRTVEFVSAVSVVNSMTSRILTAVQCSEITF